MFIKKALYIITTLSLILLTQKAHAMAVTDPGSYAYYAQQLTQMGQQAKTLAKQALHVKQQYDELKKQGEDIVRMKENLEGNLKRARGFDMSMNELLNKIVNTTNPLEQQKSFLNESGRRYNDDFDLSKPENVSEIIDNIYAKNTPENLGVKEMIVKKYQSDSYKSALENAEVIINGIDKRAEEINDLAKTIDETKNTKDSADVNNRLTLEILQELQKTNQLLAQIARSINVGNFKGEEESKEKMESRISQIRRSTSSIGRSDSVINKDTKYNFGKEPKLLTRTPNNNN